MASNVFCALCGLVIATLANLHGVNSDKSRCDNTFFWNPDVELCVSCGLCINYPKTPSCNTCKVYAEEESDAWKLAAITSISVLVVVLVVAALIIGVMVHRRKSQKRPLREPIEETTGPLYQA